MNLPSLAGKKEETEMKRLEGMEKRSWSRRDGRRRKQYVITQNRSSPQSSFFGRRFLKDCMDAGHVCPGKDLGVRNLILSLNFADG